MQWFFCLIVNYNKNLIQYNNIILLTRLIECMYQMIMLLILLCSVADAPVRKPVFTNLLRILRKNNDGNWYCSIADLHSHYSHSKLIKFSVFCYIENDSFFKNGKFSSLYRVVLLSHTTALYVHRYASVNKLETT